MSRTLARRGSIDLTDQQRMNAAFEQLTVRGIAWLFDLRGASGIREDRLNAYLAVAERAGTDLWVGEHVGSVDSGGGFWGDDGRLYGGEHRGRHALYQKLWWSWNHERPELAPLLVDVFTTAGFDAWWGGDIFDSVVVTLGDDR